MVSTKAMITLEEGWDHEIKPKAIDVLLDILNRGFENVHEGPFPPKVFMPIYTTCYNMCTQRSPFNYSEQLYKLHGETFDEYLEKTVLPSLQQTHDEFFLPQLVKRWENHKIMNQWMYKFFMYLNRYYVKHHALPTLEEAGMQSFYRVIFQKVASRAKSVVLQLIDKERNGELIDTAMIKNCVEIFEVMGMKSYLSVYQNYFENEFLQNTGIYYLNKSKSWLTDDSTPLYLKKVEEALMQERQRVSRYLNASTEPKVIRRLETVLLEEAQKELIERENSGVIALMSNDKMDDLSRMFRLFSRIEHGLEPIADLVQLHITAVGNAIVEKRIQELQSGVVKDAASDPEYIKEILFIHDKFRNLVNEQFGGNNLFQKALKDAFVDFVNKDVGSDNSAKLMSTFCDRILKTGGEKLSDEQVETFLEKVVSVFSYMIDKDLFAEIYRNQLAKRLLNQRSASTDAELLMIGKLKLRCGAQFTSKMEGMMNDLTIGTDHQQDFESFLKSQSKVESGESDKSGASIKTDTGAIEFTAQVLTTGYWPSYKILEVTMPPPMVQCMSSFKIYYDSKTSHRRLQWMHSLGNATVRASFSSRKQYDLQVTTLQAVALLLFNDAEGPFSFETLREALNLSVDVVKRILHSLSCGKYKILTKTPPGKTISTNDYFALNKTFSCPMRKIRIPMASLEDSHSQKHVEDDRSIAIEAAIVRIMKARKSLQHQQLISEVLSQLSFFRPNLKVIKRRIEALIDRDYLERDPKLMSKNQKSEISQGLLTSLHPIPIPSIPHNHCNTLKKAFYYELNQESEWCISKATATRIVQELKRGKAKTIQILDVMEKQLCEITNYLHSTPATHDIKKWNHSSRKCLPSKKRLEELVIKNQNDVIKSVKDEERKFQSIQLWRYVDEAGFFKIISARDIESIFTAKDQDIHHSSTDVESLNPTNCFNEKFAIGNGQSNPFNDDICREIDCLDMQLDVQRNRNNSFKAILESRLQSETAELEKQRGFAEVERQYQDLTRYKKEILRKKKNEDKRRLRFCPLRL